MTITEFMFSKILKSVNELLKYKEITISKTDKLFANDDVFDTIC